MIGKPDIRVGSAVFGLVRSGAPSLTKVAPVVADADTKYPFAVYRRIATSVDLTKDRVTGLQRATYTLSILANTYEGGLLLAQSVIDKIVGYRGIIGNFSINDISLDTADEETGDDVFIQNLTVTITYNPII